MTTVRTLITNSLKNIGALVKSETPDDDEVNDAVNVLNSLLSSLSNESLNVYANVWESFTLTGNDGEYTIGTGQDFDTARPIVIVESYVRQSSVDYPLSIINDVTYNNFIQMKSTQGIPSMLNYDNGYPYGKVRLYPVPASTYTLFILSEKELSSVAVDDVISLPPGWELFLTYTLSVMLAPQYGQPVDPSIADIAQKAKASIQMAVARNKSLDSQPRTLGHYNIYSNR